MFTTVEYGCAYCEDVKWTVRQGIVEGTPEEEYKEIYGEEA